MTHFIRAAAALAFLGALLSACAPKFNPAPDYVGGFLWNNNKSRVVQVAAGDTLYAISRRHDVPTKSIIARNDLQPPYELRIGQQLILDPARSYQVKAGDTLSKIARQYDVEMRLIAEANDLLAPFIIGIGQELWIPDPFSIAAAPTIEPAIASAAPVPRPAPPPAAIAREELKPPPGAEIQPGPVVGTPPPQSAPSPPLSVARQPLPEPVPDARAPSPSSAPVGDRGVPSAAPARPAPAIETEDPKPLTRPAPRATARFIWPIEPTVGGRVIAGFGPAGKGLHNDGVNIAAPAGATVRAADNGVVAYSGNELKGFGNLLLIKHADGWTTAYAHNATLLVKRGDVVKQGQIVATVGRTGNVQAPQLHFEVRKGTQAVDPLLHLDRPGGSASAGDTSS
jgi:murein DD-endopeptidase MepM/ murein hydrolase activator NlpD